MRTELLLLFFLSNLNNSSLLKKMSELLTVDIMGQISDKNLPSHPPSTDGSVRELMKFMGLGWIEREDWFVPGIENEYLFVIDMLGFNIGFVIQEDVIRYIYIYI